MIPQSQWIDSAQEFRFERKKPQSVSNLSVFTFVSGLIITLCRIPLILGYRPNLLAKSFSESMVYNLIKEYSRNFSHIQVIMLLHWPICLSILYIYISECMYWLKSDEICLRLIFRMKIPQEEGWFILIQDDGIIIPLSWWKKLQSNMIM